MVNPKTISRRKQRKKLEELLGGKCQICGSTLNLQFHHFIPSLKKERITLLLRKSFEEAVEEAKKCVLLCHDCHKKEHGWNE